MNQYRYFRSYENKNFNYKKNNVALNPHSCVYTIDIILNYNIILKLNN